MELTPKDLKFLTIMNETRLSEGKLFKRDIETFGKVFSFDDKEVSLAVKKLVKLGMLSELKLGEGEIMYFHTDKVPKNKLDTELTAIRR